MDISIPKIKEYLSVLKQCEGEREEGYEGHFIWQQDDPKIEKCMVTFYKAVKLGKGDVIEAVLSSLVVGSDEGRLNEIYRLLSCHKQPEIIKEVLLLAISIGSRPLVEFILVLFNDFPHRERSGCSSSSNFAPHITPLMLACLYNNFSIVQCLLKRGHSIAIPHFPKCECDDCARTSLSSRANIVMVDVMRAVSSEAYLWLATDDVFAACCSVAKDLQTLIKQDETDYVSTYRSLELNVQRLLARISDMAWRSEEFNVMVSNPNHCARRHSDLEAPRLQMALDANMRQFICTTNAQTSFRSVFRRDWLNFGKNGIRDFGRIMRHTVLFVPLAILHCFVPNLAGSFSVPMARMISHASSYAIFLFVALFHPLVHDFGFDALGSAQRSYGYKNLSFYTEIYLYVYVFSLFIERLILFYRIGSELFFSFWWRCFDVILIGSFVISLTFFVAVNTGASPMLTNNVPRKHWASTDFALLHEIFLSFACIVAIAKIFYYMQLIKGIGASVISVGKCIGKVYTYLVIMLIVIFAFSIGLTLLVGPYVGKKAIGVDGKPIATADAYSSIGRSTKNLFWSIFGYLGPSTYVAVAGNLGPDKRPMEHHLNSVALELIGGVYHGIIIITLMNLMTSMLVKKADEVLDNEELEFKYTRAVIYSEFLSWETAVPPPLNLLLIPLHFIYRKINSNSFRSPSWGQKPPEDTTMLQWKYENIMHCLFERFCASKEVKYKSIWRSEFEREEKTGNKVAYLQHVLQEQLNLTPQRDLWGTADKVERVEYIRCMKRKEEVIARMKPVDQKTAKDQKKKK